MRTCPICGSEFDERAFQLLVEGVGAFDSMACVEEAVRREGRRARGELFSDLIEAARAGATPGANADPGGKIRTPPVDRRDEPIR